MDPSLSSRWQPFRVYGAQTTELRALLAIGHSMCVGGSTMPISMSYRRETLKISLMAHFSATWSASDRPVSSFNSGTEARIEVPQAPEDRAR